MFDDRVIAEAVGQMDGTIEALGNSPDGLGEYQMQPYQQALPQQPYPYPMQTMQEAIPYPQMPMPTQGNNMAQHGELEFLEPQEVSDSATMRSAGITVVTAAIGGAIGYSIAGSLGALNGILYSGAFFNAYRAQKWWGEKTPDKKHEAVVSGIFALIGIGAAGYLTYYLMQEKDKK